MTFSTGSSVRRNKFPKGDVSAMIAESREACKRLRKLGLLRKTVATHPLKELSYLRAVEKLATWRRRYGFDECDVRDDQWVHGPLPPTPEQTTANMWAAANALKEAISMSGEDRSRQRVESFINKLEQGTASPTDEEFTKLKRMIVERRGHAAAHVVVAPIDSAPPRSPRSRSSKISFDVRVCMERNDEGRMDPERGQLKPQSAGIDFETPGQQCLPNWEMGRTAADGYLLAGASSSLRGNTSSLAEVVVGTRSDSETATPSTSSKTVFLQMSRKSEDSKLASKENKQFDPGRK